MKPDEQPRGRSADGQVEIRGYRIELGQIRAASADLAGVEQAVVIAREQHPGDEHLVGYVTESFPGALDPAGVRAELAERLPSYMVPVAVVVLEALPLTADGEVGRRVLPVPEYHDSDSYRAIEKVLVDIFVQVLRGSAGTGWRRRVVFRPGRRLAVGDARDCRGQRGPGRRPQSGCAVQRRDHRRVGITYRR